MRQRYRINTATTAVRRRGAAANIVVLPRGAVVTASCDVASYSTLEPAPDIAVEWEGQVVSVPLEDLLDRGELLRDGDTSS